MARRSRSSVKRLPKELLDQVNARLDAGDTYDEIVARIKDAGGQVSRSALGRYAKDYEKVGERLREMREVASAFKRELGDAAQSDAGQLLIQIVHTMAFKAGVAAMEDEDGADHKMIANLARAVANLERARKTSVDTAVALREKFKAGLAKVEAEVKSGNLSASEVLERAKAIVRGELAAWPMASLITLYAYQQRWLADQNRFKLGMFARQTGKTFTTALELVEHCLDSVAQGIRCRWVILSRGERQAKEAIDEGVALHAKNYKAAIQATDYDWKSPEGFSFKAQEVIFAPNVRVTALPANPDTARGFSANVFLDEFAFHANSKAIWTALFPVISNGDQKLRVVSTPNGKGNKFYELVTGKDAIWSRHIVDIYQAVRDGLPRDIEQLRAALNDDDAWAQEFELQWLDEASAWLSYELISSCEHEDAGRPELYEGGDVYIGNDIGVRRDLWVGWAVEDLGDRLITREIRTLRRKSFAEQDRALDEMVDTYNVRRIAMDQTGMGEKPVEDAKRRYGESRVEGVLFSAPRKTVLATVGKQAFEDRRIAIPMGDPQVRADLHKLRRVVGPTGNARFLADSDADGHADRAWACFLALAAAANPSAPIEFEAIQPPAEPYEGFGAGVIARSGYRGF